MWGRKYTDGAHATQFFLNHANPEWAVPIFAKPSEALPVPTTHANPYQIMPTDTSLFQLMPVHANLAMAGQGRQIGAQHVFSLSSC